MNENTQMSEEEAIESLAQDLAQTQEPQEPQEPKINEPQTNEPLNQAPVNNEPSKQDQINEKVLEALTQLLQYQPQNTQEQAPKEPSQLELALNELGLGEVAQKMSSMQEQLSKQQEILAKQAEQQAQINAFNDNLTKFKKEFPTINPDEMGKWASENGFSELITQDYKGWQLLAKIMLKTAQPSLVPDPITSSSGNNGAQNAFDRLKKGESVDELELGTELLKIAGAK